MCLSMHVFRKIERYMSSCWASCEVVGCRRVRLKTKTGNRTVPGTGVGAMYRNHQLLIRREEGFLASSDMFRP